MSSRFSLPSPSKRFLSRRNILAGLTVLVGAALAFAPPTLAATKKKASSGSNPRYASLIMDADTGQILHQRYADKVLHPASLVKMMTLAMTFDALQSGQISLRDRVYISKRATQVIPSKLDLAAGTSIRVEDAIYALVTKSANDIAVALAEKIGGSESRFASLMTQKARMLGMSNTRFTNASGLHDPAQVTTARDMARLSRHLIYDHPQYYHYFSTRNFTYMGRNYHNHNRLMSQYAGMDGLKTGYIAASGFNLAASAKRDGRRLIGVVFGGRSAPSRNAHMAQLLDQAFDAIGAGNVRVAGNIDDGGRAAAPIPGRKPVVSAQQMASLVQTAPAAGQEESAKWASLNAMMQSDAIGEMIGQGDYDPSVSKRFETGLMAINAIKQESRAMVGTSTGAPPNMLVPVSVSRAALINNNADWAVQIGAFASRVKTDQAIRQAVQNLPPEFTHATPVIMPLQTKEGWIFRGRLSGLSKSQATLACRRLSSCMPIAPQAN